MTKTELKNAITEMVNRKYDTECEWAEEDVNMLDYYYATFGKNCSVNEDNCTIVFSKSGYTSEVSVESWQIVCAYDEKKEMVVFQDR